MKRTESGLWDRIDAILMVSSEGAVELDDIKKLFKRPLPSARNGAFFNTFSYPTKISPESIAVYIAAMTEPGETVLDTFGGSGSTGIAALLCEHPTERMKALASELSLEPVWGARNAIGYEIGTYGSFAAQTISNRLKANEFKKAVVDFVGKEKDCLMHYYSAVDPNGEVGTIRYIIWSEVLLCPYCGGEISYFENGTKRNPVVFEKVVTCPHCKKKASVDDMKYQTDEYMDGITGKPTIRKKRIPSWIYGTTDGKNWDRPATDEDNEKAVAIEKEMRNLNDVPKEIQWGELHRNGYHFGISYLHQFYTARNYLIMRKLWDATGEYSAKVRDALRLLLLSYNASHCTMMTRVVAKKNSKDFVLTGAQSGVLYISKLPVEKNIILGLERKAKPFYDAYKMLEKCTGSFIVRNESSERLEEKNNTIGFVFTDPPFGDFIPYAEVNQINELWLEKPTEREKEIIISASQNKGINDYQAMLTSVFSEIRRVLKDSSYAAVVFHSAKAQVWTAFENAVSNAGLNIELTNILDKKQASFKQVVSEASVQGDPLLLLRKGIQHKSALKKEEDIIEKIVLSMKDESVFDERRAYSLYINECLQNNIHVTYDAKDAYVLIRQLRRGLMDAALQG